MKWKVDSEYYEIIRHILKDPEFLKRKDFPHHGELSVYDHSVLVSKIAYYVAKKFGYDYKSATIAGLLHDFYTKPWQGAEKKPFFESHGFTHAKEALENSKIHFGPYINPKIEDAILRHMFPLNLKPPKYKESWIVNMADNIASANVLISPKILWSFTGIKPKTKKKVK